MLDNSYRLNEPSCIAEAVEDDLIVINLISGRYYNMRQQTVTIWQALAQGVTPATLLNANAWSSDQQKQFEQHVSFLIQEQLLVLVPDSTSQGDAPQIELDGQTNPFHVDVFTDMEEMLRLDPIHDANADTGWPHKP